MCNNAFFKSPGEVPLNPETLPDMAFARMGAITITAETDNSPRTITNVDASGKVYIHGGRVVLDKGYIFADTWSTEDGEGITIRADDELLAKQARITAQTVKTNLFDNVTGDAGDITVSAGRITLSEGARIDSSCRNNTSGAAGNIYVSAEEDISISGRFSAGDNKNYSSGILSNTASHRAGGRIVVTAPRLVLQGGVIRTDTIGSGDAGDVLVQTDKLILTDGGQINVDAGNQGKGGGKGRGGELTINAQDSVLISGKNEEGLSSGLVSNTFTKGEGGSIMIFTPVLEVKNGGTVQAGSKAAGKGGNLLLDAGCCIFIGTVLLLRIRMAAEKGEISKSMRGKPLSLPGMALKDGRLCQAPLLLRVTQEAG
ncbi:MAG: hypothetical protein GY862_36730 [Gammaproteobacteria bacterium]|nr:hypothetical protein [Gammaproteobacteria bacterium]